MADRKATATAATVALTPEDIADAAEVRATTYADASVGEVVIVDGYGVVVAVRRGCLELATVWVGNVGCAP